VISERNCLRRGFRRCVTIGVSHCAEFPFPINCARMSC
jgi:hypothetical protein